MDRAPSLSRILLYVRDVEETAAFYAVHFGYEARREEGDRIVELAPPGAGAILMLHPAAKGMKQGQAAVKMVFDVEDVAGFCAQAREAGLHFGPVHQAGGYQFANAKDPAGNSVSISSRAFRRQ